MKILKKRICALHTCRIQCLSFFNSISVSYNLVGKEMEEGDHLRCGWIAFINCFAGIVGIITLTLMSYISYSGITTISTTQGNKISTKMKILFISLVWIFAFVLCKYIYMRVSSYELIMATERLYASRDYFLCPSGRIVYERPYAWKSTLICQ